jgi:hypothetical protein
VAGRYGAGLSESCGGWPGGRGAPRLGFGGHAGPPTATQLGKAAARGVRGRPILSSEPARGPPLLAGRAPVMETAVGRAGGENRAAALDRTGAFAHDACARRVGRRPPRPCFARRAYRARGGRPPPYRRPIRGHSSTGAQACTYLVPAHYAADFGAAAGSDANLLRGGRSEAEAGVRAVRRVGAGAALVPC